MNSPDRLDLDSRYEQVFAGIIGFTTATCRSSARGPSIAMEIRFDLGQRPRTRLADFHFILRDLPKEYQYRLVPRSALLQVSGDAAKLTFLLEPAN